MVCKVLFIGLWIWVWILVGLFVFCMLLLMVIVLVQGMLCFIVVEDNLVSLCQLWQIFDLVNWVLVECGFVNSLLGVNMVDVVEQVWLVVQLVVVCKWVDIVLL